MADDEADVIVVGAGLAGLQCALDLERAGRHVTVVEAADDVGGRIRTDRVDGFLVDRGFQLLNPAYPAVARWVDVDALALQSFDAGVRARIDDGFRDLGLPWRAPARLPGTAVAGARDPRSTLGLVRWARPLLGSHRGLGRRLAARPDRSWSAALDAVGVEGELRRILESFLAGVVLDDPGATSDHLVALLVSSFLRGTPGLPRAGMQQLPRQLAAQLRSPVRLGDAVVEVRDAGGGAEVRTAGEAVLRARAVVVAAEAADAAGLLGRPVPPAGGVRTAWFEVPVGVDVVHPRLLRVDARRAPGGPLVNAAMVSAAAPSYRPPGRGHLVAASWLGPDTDDTAVQAAARHAGELLGIPSSGWSLVALHDVPRALPRVRPPLDATQEQRVSDRVWWAGDHRDTPSIQGALVSGHRAARAVLG